MSKTSFKVQHFTSKMPIPAAIPPTMLACSLRIFRICSKQPWGRRFSSYKPSDPWLLIRRFISWGVPSPALCSAVPRPAGRGRCLSSSSSVAGYLCSPSQTWSPQSRCSCWSHSTWAGRSRISCQQSIHPSFSLSEEGSCSHPSVLTQHSGASHAGFFSHLQSEDLAGWSCPRTNNGSPYRHLTWWLKQLLGPAPTSLGCIC